MQILSPNAGSGTVFINKDRIYLSITDYGARSILKEIKTVPWLNQWCWIDLAANRPLDLSEKRGNNYSFDHAINRKVNDVYCTVYQFEDFAELCRHWDDIKYIDAITTVYKAKEDKNQGET